MKIEHIAIWTCDLENMKHFYIKYFNMISSEKYENKNKKFSSYFLSFNEGGSRIELMHNPDIANVISNKDIVNGLAHFSISVGNKHNVNALTETMRKDGCQIVGEPRTTGDGYYESVVLDCEGNRIEITE